MASGRRPKALHIAVLFALVLASVLAAAPPAVAQTGRVAYIYSNDTASRDSFSALLSGRGIAVDAITVQGAAAANFSTYQAIIIGNDTGSLSSWGTTESVNKINQSGKPILGVGEGGYAFFGRLSLQIGWGNGAHGSASQTYVVYPSLGIFTTPSPVSVPSNRTLSLYTSNQNVVEIFQPRNPLASPIGRSTSDARYLPLTSQTSGGRCYTLWGFGGAPSAMTADGQNLFVNMVAGNPCAPLSLTSNYAATPPSIDGAIGVGEWAGAGQLPFGRGTISVVNDGIRLYILVNVLDDTADDPPSQSASGDYFWLTFDVDRDGQIDANLDLNYTTIPGTRNMRLQRYLNPSQWTTLQGPIRSSLGPGFGCFFADGTLSIGGGRPFNLQCKRHRVWEFGIDLREIGAQAGGSARMGLRVSSPNPQFTDDLPVGFSTGFANLIQIALGSAPAVVSTGASIGFQANPLEVTQAVQTPSNSLPLVARKSTVARAYVRSNGANPEPAIVYLYGSRGGADMPGSPLALLISARPSPDRLKLGDSANFILPPSWITQGTTSFQLGAARLTGAPSFSGVSNLNFQSRRTPIYWTIPLNTGTNASPNTASSTVLDSQESYLKALYPVPNVKFVRKPWQSVGAIGSISLEQTIQKLHQYHGSVVLAWVFGVLFGGGPPFDLPDQIYGFRTSGGGLSDPLWYGGAGYVGAGYLGTSLEGTMAHEINHNLDKNASGTWGLHVGGCDADGPYPDWPYANFNVNEVGFDTRLPWSTSSSRYTVIPSNVPDLMSYCQSGKLPTKWISPYRWQKQFAYFAPPSISLAQQLQQVQAGTNYYYISGQLTRSGSGKLDPVLVQPGFDSDPVPPGDYSIEIQNATGDTTLETLPFTAVFDTLEGEKRDTVFFSFRIPEQAGGARIVLKKGNQVLDTIVRSATTPGVTITAPGGGESWSGLRTISWTASDPDPGTSLSFSIFYSPDNGSSWFPVAAGVKGNSYQVDTGALPGGTQGKIRIIATDGFNTSAPAESSGTFTVGDKPPAVSILAPENAAQFERGATIVLEGYASDLQDSTIPDESFVWSYAPQGAAPGAAINLGTGRQVSANLPDGVHEVTLTAFNSRGLSGTTKITVRVGSSQIFLPYVRRQ